MFCCESSSDCLPTQLYVVAMLGAMKAGAAYLPLVGGQEATSARYCRAARPGLVLVEDGAATGELGSLEARVVTSSELRAALGRDAGAGEDCDFTAAVDPW